MGDDANAMGDAQNLINNIPSVPGGEKKVLPDEPQLTEGNKTMGCTKSKSDESVNPELKKMKQTEPKQSKIDEFFPSKNGNSHDQTRNNEQENKTAKSNNRPRSRSSSNNSTEFMSDQDEYSNSRTRSGKQSTSSLSKIRMNFDDSDDENATRVSWAKRDIAEYRDNYPDVRSNQRKTTNYKFYTNQIASHPDGDFIDNIHKHWFGDYSKLEYHHGYIQWLFPLQEKGLNWSADPLEKHEIKLISDDPIALNRLLKSYELMLDFYGFKLDDQKTGRLQRLSADKCKERFRNLNMSSHNYLRITRILKCLGEFKYEYLKRPFLEAILREAIQHNTLPNCLRSCRDYWIETLRSQSERRQTRAFARDLIKWRDDGKPLPRTPQSD